MAVNRTMKGPWWVVPGLGALLISAGVVSVAQGWLSLGKVSLPQEVRLGHSAALAHPRVAAAPTSAVVAVPATSGGTVVAAWRPVVSEPSRGQGSVSTGGVEDVTATPASGTADPPSDPVSTGSVTGSAAPADPTTPSTGVPPPTSTTSTTTTTPSDDAGPDDPPPSTPTPTTVPGAGTVDH